MAVWDVKVEQQEGYCTMAFNADVGRHTAHQRAFTLIGNWQEERALFDSAGKTVRGGDAMLGEHDEKHWKVARRLEKRCVSV